MIENGLVLPARVRDPVRRDAVVPPGVGQLAQLAHRDGGSRRASGEPAFDVLFRPERFIVLQVKTMSSHQREAGTRQ